MNAVRLVFDRMGKPSEALRIESFAPRKPRENEALVRIEAAPLNPADLNTIEGTYGEKLSLPATPGIEGCGIVEESGGGDFRPGDRVMFLKRAATWATHTTVPATALFRLPRGIDPLQAAMLKVNPATAWCLLHHFETLRPGELVVQNLGNSAVGRCVIQLARMQGVRTVSFVRNAAQIPALTTLGGDHVFSDDEEGLVAAKEITGGMSAALAFNAVGGDSALRLMKLLRPGGTHITYGAMGRKPVMLPNGLLLFQDIRLRGLWVTRWLENSSPEEVRMVYGKLAELIAAGALYQPVDSTFPLRGFLAALARLDALDRRGKVLFSGG